MATANKRVPLSCEPCRERKIRCYRTSPGFGSTCDTCVRRGIPLEECIFLRDLPRSQRPINRRLPRTNTASQSATSHELFARIEKLESLLSASGRLVDKDTSSSTIAASQEHRSFPSPSSSSNQYGQEYLSPSTDVANHRMLTRTTSGHERYEPFPGVFTSHLHGEAIASAAASSAERPPSCRQFPFTPMTSSMNELLSTLPSLRHCDALKDLYVRVFGSLFHILHDPTFEKDYATFRANPQHASCSWLALLYSVLAVAVTAMDETDDVLHDLGKHANPFDNLVHLTSTYRAAAMRCLDADQYLWQHNLRTLQTLILLIYGISHTHGTSWVMLGTARNIALSLGCHLDPDEFGLDVIEAEQRRRCWAALSMLYTVQNVTLGSIDSSTLSRNVKLPLDLNDDELGRISSTRGPTQMTYLLFKFRLYDLFSRIANVMGDRGAPPSYDDVINLDAEITGQQDLWSAKYLADTRDTALPDYHNAHLQILSGYSHQLCLLLHKPVITQPQHPAATTRRRYTRAQISQSQNRCRESACALLDIHSLLHDSTEMHPYQWYNRGLGSFHAFHAVATIVFISETCTTIPVGEIMQLKQDVDNATVVFQSISDSGMSIMCRKALPVIRQFQKRMGSLNTTHGRPPQPMPYHILGVDTGLASPASQGNDQQTQIGSPGNYSAYMDAMIANLQPAQWMSPSTVTWDIWDNLVGGV